MKRIKKILKWTGLLLLILIVLLSVITFALQFRKYKAPFPDLHASTDSTVIARGKYLVTTAAACAECHTPESEYQRLLAGQITSLRGGRVFHLPFGTIQAPNITSDKETGIGSFTDGEIARALRYGVGKDGRAMGPFMNYQNMSDEDITAIISYLRSIPAEKNKITIRKWNVLGYIANAFLLKPHGPTQPLQKFVERDTTVPYGAYIATSVSVCAGCHNSRELNNAAFAGGNHFSSRIDPQHYECVAPNLTSDEETGRTGQWNEAGFIQRFKMGKLIPHSEMPWGCFQKMDSIELKAIYKYLRTVPSVRHETDPVLVNINQSSN